MRNNAHLNVKPIISVNEARKLLANDSKVMSDVQVQALIDEADKLARLAIDVAKDKLARDNHGGSKTPN